MTIGGSTTLATSALALQQQARQEQIGIAMIKQEAQAQQALIALIEQTAGPPPAPGTGQIVDRRA